MNNTPYVPVKEDFQFLPDRDITTDQNFASQGYWKGVAISFFRNKRAVVGLVIVLLIMFFAAFGPMMNVYKYDTIVSITNDEGKQFVAKAIGPQISGVIQGSGKNAGLFPEHTFLFGTDDMISGFFGGMTDNIMQRIVEIGNSVPRLVIVSVLAIFMPKGMVLVIVALLLTEWIGMSKISRAEMLKLKEHEYVLASRTLGAGSFHIIFKEILPNTIGPIITQVMFSIPTAIFTEAFLSFVGVGIVLPQCSIGSLIEAGFNNITTLPYQILPPIIVLALLMLGFNFIGDGFREALAPKLEDM